MLLAYCWSLAGSKPSGGKLRGSLLSKDILLCKHLLDDSVVRGRAGISSLSNGGAEADLLQLSIEGTDLRPEVRNAYADPFNLARAFVYTSVGSSELRLERFGVALLRESLGCCLLGRCFLW